MTEFSKNVYAAVQSIPRGCVMSYGRVAALAGNPRAARGVGFALHHNPYPGVVPCHRVVFSDGRLASAFAFGGEGVQRALLEAGAAQVWTWPSAGYKEGVAPWASCMWTGKSRGAGSRT